MRIPTRILLIAACFLISQRAGAIVNTPTIKTDSLKLNVYFPQDVSVLELDYRDNERRLNRFETRLLKVLDDPSNVITNITITSSASPEGKSDHNQELSENRGIALRNYLEDALDLPDSIFTINAIGEDWAGLRRLVIRNNIPHCDEIVDIIDNVPQYIRKNGVIVDGRKKRLMEMDGGRTWNYMLRTIYPDLRNSNNKVVCYIERKAQTGSGEPAPGAYENIPHRVDTLYIVTEARPVDTVYTPVSENAKKTNRKAARPIKQEKPWKQYYFAAGSNALFDLAGCPNVELEFPIGNKFSVVAEHWFPWYIFGDDRYAYEILYSGAEFRWWLGDRSRMDILEGWFAGLYGGATMYDVEWDEKGYQGESYLCAGFTAGKSWKLSNRWRMEASLSLGYAHTDYRYYEHNKDVDLLIWQRDGKYDWIGPTKAKVTFSYLIGLKRKPKGGEK